MAESETGSGPWAGRRLHFLGANGLALIARSLGASVTVSGADDPVALERTRRFAHHGIRVSVGYDATNVPPDAEVVTWTMIGPDNPEVRGASRVVHRADLIAELAAERRCVIVAGAHGKTTTSTMITHILRVVGMDPSYVLGGAARDTTETAHLGSGEWMVVEVDESDRSLLRHRPEIAVLVNAENDHDRTYEHLADVHEVFGQYLAGARQQVVWDRPEMRTISPDGAVFFDPEDVQPTASGLRMQWNGHAVELSIRGRHNAIDAASALTACALAGVDPHAAVAAIATFPGVRDRFEQVGTTPGGARVVLDFAHHPTQVATVLAGAREVVSGRLVAVIEPIHYSRVRALADELGTAVAAADEVVVMDVLPHTEDARDYPGVTVQPVVDSARRELGADQVHWLPEPGAVVAQLRSTLGEGDLCVVMGVDDAVTVARDLVR